jgi:hypothetical protein
MFVSADYQYLNNGNDDDANIVISVNSVTLLNSGWIAVDSSVRAGAKARKIAERNTKDDTSTSSLSSSSSKTNNDLKASSSPSLLTEADE